MYRTHTCGELRISDAGKVITLAGWVQKTRNFGGMTFVDLRDRYGITQLVFNMETNADLCRLAMELGREFVIRATGLVAERSNKNPNMPTGDVEIHVDSLLILNPAGTPPFTIEENSDGGDELRMKYRYLDMRRAPLQRNLMLRHRMAQSVRHYLDLQGFIEVETPVMIKSTPEGARDFVVPSRMNPGQFYALPQSPQMFKQLLMVSGFDRYMQIVKCFRDEDLRADRQPEFTQIDCEMAFVEQDDILNTFEGLAKHLFREVLQVEFEAPFLRLPYEQAMAEYGSDKPDLRFGMKITEIGAPDAKRETRNAEDETPLPHHASRVTLHGFPVFDEAEYIGGIVATGCAEFSRKQTDELTEFVKKPQIGAKGLIYVKYNPDGTIKSSVDRFFDAAALQGWAEVTGAKTGDLLLILAGKRDKTLKALGELRLEMGRQLNLMDKNMFVPLWVIDFPLVEWDEETRRFYAMHHPFTAPKPEDIPILDIDPGKVHANAYDLVINGIEIGGGSIRIHDSGLQKRMFEVLGFTDEQAQYRFGFLMNAFKYGAPPHGGIAFGFDRWVSLFAGLTSIRDVIAFPKNNQGRDIMQDSPSIIDDEQLKELGIRIVTSDPRLQGAGSSDSDPRELSSP
ncbi:MAG: aspartate--tRNA ligase [Bacteroidia bacterium]|nr:aspartate--tRNA ligase [Bacteroidia bacterium]